MLTALTDSYSIHVACEALSAEYEVEPEQPQMDLCSFIYM